MKYCAHGGGRTLTAARAMPEAYAIHQICSFGRRLSSKDSRMLDLLVARNEHKQECGPSGDVLQAEKLLIPMQARPF